MFPVVDVPEAAGSLLDAAGAPVSLLLADATTPLVALGDVPASLAAEDGSVPALATIEADVAIVEAAGVLGPHGPTFATGCPLTKIVVVQSPPNPPVVKPPGPLVVGAPPDGN